MSYTLGDWTIIESVSQSDKRCWDITAIDGAGWTFLAEVVNQDDARLIASAPYLLEALEDMTARFERCCKYNGSADGELLAEATRDAHAAIAKAKGE